MASAANAGSNWREAHGIDRQANYPFVALRAPIIGNSIEAKVFPDLVAEAVAGKPQVRLIVLETVNKMGVGLDLNGTDMVQITSYAERLAERFDCFVLLVHHKSDKTGAAEAMNSAYFKTNVDVFYIVTRAGKSMNGCIKLGKYKDGEDGQEWFYAATEKAWDAYSYTRPDGIVEVVGAGKSLHLVSKAPEAGERQEHVRARDRMALGADMARLGL